MSENEFPSILSRLHEIPFDYLDGDGIDFEPYQEFLSSAETNSWLRAWTGNESVEGREFRVFGQDGTGGLAAFWLVRADRPTLEQPIVFFGSEGELGVVASNFEDYLWLLAQGVGPFEAIAYRGELVHENSAFRDFAQKNAPGNNKHAMQLVKDAAEEFPNFPTHVEAMCK